jgi:hypothetical protein
MNRYFSRKFHPACRLALALAIVASLVSACSAGAEKVLYDVKFDDPPHTPSNPPVYGYGAYPRNTPTAGGQILHPFGSATVVNSFGPLSSKSVRLQARDDTPNNPVLGGANLEFDLSDPAIDFTKRVYASVDVLPANLRTASGLGIFFDSPSIHSVQFLPDGNIRLRDALGLDSLVGPYLPETIYHVSMTLDRVNQRWAAAINGVPLFNGPAHGTELDKFRIAMTTGDHDSPATAYVDNIKIAIAVPEPGTIGLAGLAVSGVLAFATRRRRSRQL